MKHLCLFIQILAILILINLKQIKAQNSELKYPEEKYFKNVRQITFSGENAEAYWSFDDSKLIFQATNEQWGESCDQIYIIDTNDYSLKQSIPKRISLGEGRTTCSYFCQVILRFYMHQPTLKTLNVHILPIEELMENMYGPFTIHMIFSFQI